MRNLLKYALLAILGLISYNYFYGNAEEKARSEKVIDGVKDVFVSIKELAVAEKDKFEEGKYDKVLDQIGLVFKDFQEKSTEIGEGLKNRLADLEIEKRELENRIQENKNKGIWSEAEKKQTKEDFEKLIKKTETLFKDME